jgi:hypothetical protein
MAEEDGLDGKYVFVTENGETKSMSRGYTGKATATYPNKDSYEGDFLDGIREGRGTYLYFASADRYDGEWKVNRKHGIGKMYYNKKGEYQGYWENGRRHGEGVFTYPNGDVYSGWWRFGEKEGTGHYTSGSTGMTLFGNWKNGSLKDGKWTYPNGIHYAGQFENNKPIGEGTWFFKIGNELKGVYTQKPKELGEDEEPPAEEEEGADAAAPKSKFDIHFQAYTNISHSAHLVNSVEQ